MSVVGSPIDGSLLQSAQASQVASKSRDREKGSEAARRLEDRVELRVAGVEDADAVRRLPRNDSEQADSEHRSTPDQPDQQGRQGRPGEQIDLTA